jgi:hypothetical protein
MCMHASCIVNAEGGHRLLADLTVCSCADVACVHVQHPAEPKVCDLEAHAPLLLAPLEQHVCCLEVTVHHADGVQVVQA